MTCTEDKAGRAWIRGWNRSPVFPNNPGPGSEALPLAHPETSTLVQQRWVRVQEGTAPIFILGHGDRAQIDEIKAIASLPLLDDHTPATKPGKGLTSN